MLITEWLVANDKISASVNEKPRVLGLKNIFKN
jgi:hypothetical protein